MPLSRREAERLGRLGGTVSGAVRKGDRAWGQRMRRRKGFVHQQRHYPELRLEWLENGRRTLAGQPLKRLPDVKLLLRVPPASSLVVQRGNQIERRV
jgi:hypothetical protein